MGDPAKAAYEEESLQLRAELKQWENDWAAAHSGKKPGRGDIKQNPDIGARMLPSPFYFFLPPPKADNRILRPQPRNTSSTTGSAT
jgi:hypothetical protein